MLLPARILGTSSVAPPRLVTTDEVLAMAMPDRDPARIKARLGMQSRRWVEPGTTTVALGGQALAAALEAADLPASALRTVIFVSSVSGERLVPATANAVAAEVGTSTDCACFDVNNACTGWLTAFDLAVRLVQGLQAPVAIVTVELLSRYCSPERPRGMVVFGDAAAATILGPGTRGGLHASDFGNDARGLDATILEIGQLRGRDEWLHFGNSGPEIVDMAVSDMVLSVDRVRAARPDLIPDWFLCHQPNGPLLQRFVERASGGARTWSIVDRWGSVAACAIPVSLDLAWRHGPIADGETLLLASVGGGSSRGAALFTVERP